MKKLPILLLSLIIAACSNNTKNDLALNAAKKIADKIIEETKFEFETNPLGDNAGIIQLELKLGETIQVNVNNNGESKNGYLALAYHGMINLQYKDQVIHTGSSNSAIINEYTYNRYRFNERIAVKWKSGDNLLSIKSMSDSCRIILLPVNDIDERDLNISLNAESLDINILDLAIDENNSYKRDSYADWHYANGGTMLGILKLYEISKNKKYLNFVKQFSNFTLENMAYFEKQYTQKYAVRGSYHRLFRKSMLDDTGGPVLPFSELAAKFEDNENYTSLLDEMLDYVLNTQERLDDSTLCRPEPIAQTVWADDLFMSVPFLLRMAKINGDSSLYDEVAKQIILFNKHLRNPETRLYFHGYFHQKQENTPVQWGRANGWVAWATSEALLHMPKDHPKYSEIVEIFQMHIYAILSFQDESGMWHQVLDIPDTYEETSCTAMFTLATLRGIKIGCIDKSFESNALKAWSALENKIMDDGTVIDICRGTGIGEDVAFYQNRKRFDHDPRGLGAILTAACEISSLQN